MTGNPPPRRNRRLPQLQEFLLRIVSEEELRADLLRREEEQRQAFEQAYRDLAIRLVSLVIDKF